MASDTLYAWSPISYGEPTRNAENPGDTTVIKPGTAVSRADLDSVTDEGWKQLIESGAIRAQEYPNIPETWQDSPVQFLRDQARKAAEGIMDDAATSQENIAAVMSANAAETGVALLPEGVEPATTPSSEATPSNSNTQFTQGNEGLLASDDGGQSWRPATDEEKAAQS